MATVLISTPSPQNRKTHSVYNIIFYPNHIAQCRKTQYRRQHRIYAHD